MPIFRGSSDATLGSGQIVATAGEIVDALNAALAAQSAAETAETNAEVAQAAAEAALDNFDDRYLGAKTSDPTVDNDGDPLIDGALYYNTTDNVTKVYDLGTTTWLNLLLSASDQANVNIVAGIASDVSTVAGIETEVTTVSGINSDVTTVSGISADVTTVSGISSDVTTVAADGTDIGTVATDITNVNTVAGISSDVTTVSGISTDVTDVSGVSADVTTVAGISSEVTTLAGVSTDITTVAGIESDVSSVAAIDTDVTTVAANVADVTNFSDVYLGPKASAPTLRNDGSALQVGDLYFDTTVEEMRVYDGAAWQATGSTVNGTSQRQSFTATASQTTFTVTGGYDSGFADVYLNGAKLVNGTDVDVSSGSDVVLTNGADAGDSVDVVAYGAFELADTYTKAEVDGFVSDLETDIADISSAGFFHKAVPQQPAWTKTGNDTAETATALTIEVNGGIVEIPSGTSISMPTLSAGTDYAIWVAPDGTLEADTSFTTPPTANGRRVGGFHYAPGGNASFDLDAGDGGTTAQINEFSFYDLTWRPSVIDPRGLTCVGDGAFWTGIYHLAGQHLSGAPHRHGVDPARDGNPPRLVDDSGNYPDAQPMNIFEALRYHGFRSPRVEEFQLLAFGTNEAASRGSDPGTTGLPGGSTDAQFTSHWGVIQSTGVIALWSNDSILSTSDETLPNPSRGDRFRVSRFAFLGGAWSLGSDSGSRSVTAFTATGSSTALGGRGVCDHLILD